MCASGKSYKVCEGCVNAKGADYTYSNELDQLLTHPILQCVYAKRAEEGAAHRYPGALDFTHGETDSVGKAQEVGISIVAAEIMSCSRGACPVPEVAESHDVAERIANGKAHARSDLTGQKRRLRVLVRYVDSK